MKLRKIAAALLVGLICIEGAQIARAEMPAPATQPAPVTQPMAGEPAVVPASMGATIRLLAVGDWGLDSPDRQTVADAMAGYADHRSILSVLLLGDNFYVKLSGVGDPLIQSFFEKTYDVHRLAVPFYAVLGNHDYKEHNDTIELAYTGPATRFKMPARWYRIDLPQDHPLVTVLMLDSDQPLMAAEDWQKELAWVEAELAKPHAIWLICCAHHDIFGNGSHGDNGVLQNTWGPLFKKYGVDFYVCGHEHTLQHLEVPGWPVSFVIAGGGGAKRKPMLRDQRGPFSKAEMGFAAMEFTDRKAVISLIDGQGKPVHVFERDHSGQTRVLMTSPSDKATTHPLRVIDGYDDPATAPASTRPREKSDD